MGKHHIIATIGSNIITSKASNIIFAQAKTSFFYRPKVKRKYNTLHLAGKEVCKKDEENLVLFELNIKLLYGRYSKVLPFYLFGFFFLLIFLFQGKQLLVLLLHADFPMYNDRKQRADQNDHGKNAKLL